MLYDLWRVEKAERAVQVQPLGQFRRVSLALLAAEGHGPGVYEVCDSVGRRRARLKVHRVEESAATGAAA